MKPFVIVATGPKLSDAAALDLIADRFTLVARPTQERLGPIADVAELKSRLSHWLAGSRRIEIDSRDPLSRLLVQCQCVPGDRRRKCRVHGWPTPKWPTLRRRQSGVSSNASER